MRHALFLLGVCCWTCSWPAEAEAVPPVDQIDVQKFVDQALEKGAFSDAEAALGLKLIAEPRNDHARFALSVVRLARGLERLGQALYRYHPRRQVNFFMNLRLPLPENPNPEEISYEKFRAMFEQFGRDLTAVEATLAAIRDPSVKLPLKPGLIRLDFNNDGKTTDDETLWTIVATAMEAGEIPREFREQFAIGFDYADVQWLRGYCHLLQATNETMLAHDFREFFERVGHLFFPRVRTPHTFLKDAKQLFNFGDGDIIDFIAMIHLLNFQKTEPARMQAALRHVEATLELSRETWKAILSETDDDREWIPSPTQKGCIPGVKITPEFVKTWHEFLDEAELILQGKRLVPHPRLKDGTKEGINLRRYLLEAPRFDLVMIVQGTDLTPYVERGSVTPPELWLRMNRTFRGQFFSFAVWFN